MKHLSASIIFTHVTIFTPQGLHAVLIKNIIAPKGRIPCKILTKFIVLCVSLVYISMPNLVALSR